MVCNASFGANNHIEVIRGEILQHDGPALPCFATRGMQQKRFDRTGNTNDTRILDMGGFGITQIERFMLGYMPRDPSQMFIG